MSLPIVAIVGRPNVGKSSLFNRLLRKKLAVVDPTPGVTRDRNYAVCDWNGREFRLIDTGGMVPDSRDEMERLIMDQSEFAIHEADLVILVVDAQTGVDTTDLRIARALSKASKPHLLAANKADNASLDLNVYEFMKLGLGEPFAVSASLGLGIGELLDELIARLPAEDAGTAEEEGAIKVAVVGRPNVGKSSFINKLTGEDRLIVSPIAGTTRDSVNTLLEMGDKKYLLIDTAGLRRRYKVQENIEFYTTLRTARAIDECDVGVVLMDAVDGLTAGDMRVLGDVIDARRGVILAVNKWDLIEKDDKTADTFTAQLRELLGPMAFVPIIFISALTGQRVSKVLATVDAVHERYHSRIATAELNVFLQEVYGKRKPPAKQGKYIQFKYLTQSETSPPTFVFFVNLPELLDKGYISYLSNQLRTRYGYEGVPIRLKFRHK
ncbi:MAG: ribosome biogenesis GTPase Der [bacterium]|nr:ribosome biogenesis GTPase Der [bacterium]